MSKSLLWLITGVIVFIALILVGTSREMARWDREARQRERRQPHAVYLRDASGDCVAVYGLEVGRRGDGPATVGHVNPQFCQPGGTGEPIR